MHWFQNQRPNAPFSLQSVDQSYSALAKIIGLRALGHYQKCLLWTRPQQTVVRPSASVLKDPSCHIVLLWNKEHTGRNREQNDVGTYIPGSAERVQQVYSWVHQLLRQSYKEGEQFMPPPIVANLYRMLSEGLLAFENARYSKICSLSLQIPFVDRYLQRLLEALWQPRLVFEVLHLSISPPFQPLSSNISDVSLARVRGKKYSTLRIRQYWQCRHTILQENLLQNSINFSGRQAVFVGVSSESCLHNKWRIGAMYFHLISKNHKLKKTLIMMNNVRIAQTANKMLVPHCRKICDTPFPFPCKLPHLLDRLTLVIQISTIRT